jgi:hypothetical protein
MTIEINRNALMGRILPCKNFSGITVERQVNAGQMKILVEHA